MTEYRIEFSLQRRNPDDADFTEIGFGSSGTCGSPDEAAYAVESGVQNRMWDTSPGMPGPSELPAGVPD